MNRVVPGTGLLLALASIGQAADGNDPAARFRGAPVYDFGVTNVRWEAATPEYSKGALMQA